MPLWVLTIPKVVLLLYAGALLFLLCMIVGWWLRFGRRARLNRIHKQIQGLLGEKSWKEALVEADRLQALGCLFPLWQERARHAQGQCQQLAGELALEEKRFEEGLDHLRTAARLLDLDESACRDRVVAEMLQELRRLFAQNPSELSPGQPPEKAGDEEATNSPILELAARIARLQAPCPEALFWEGMAHCRAGRLDKALTRLDQARAADAILDPPLYLGALLLREGREALRYLADANRIAPDCPLVAWQLGMAMVAGGGADNLAIRPLQKALTGLTAWAKTPERIWQEALPGPEKSYVARLAAKFPYRCPVFGTDVAAMVRQAQLALAQVQYRLGHFQEAADLFNTILQESPPSVAVLRGLGLALAKLERYDEAFKHLRAAHESEFSREPKASAKQANSDYLTAGYLALCGAKGKPSRPEDKPNNVWWAIRLLAKFEVKGDPEWADLNSAVFTEAHELGLSLPVQEVVRWCDVLASVDAADLKAAQAYYELAKGLPEAVKREHAWLYCRAVQQHHIHNDGDLFLFRRGLSEETSARAFYEKRGWDFEEVEYLFLTRLAAAPGTEASGDVSQLPDYLNRKLEPFLLERSKQKEQAGLEAEALASVEALLKLSPHSAAGYDRLAYLRYRRGELAQAVDALAAWHALSPSDYWPLVRRAIVEQTLGNVEACTHSIHQALSLTTGRTRAAIAFLGGRLALASRKLEQALRLFQDCLQYDPAHSNALWHLAAVRYLLKDRIGLAGLAKQIAEIADPRFHYLAAVAHLWAADFDGVIQNSQWAISALSAEGDDRGQQMIAECLYLKGRAHWLQQDIPAASVELEKAVSQAPTAPSANHARALLGKIRFSRGAYEETSVWWKAVGQGQRTEWKFDDPLKGAVYLSGLAAFRDGRFAQAVTFFRDAEELNLAEPRLPALRTAALVMAGREALSASEAGDAEARADRSRPDWQAAIQFLEEAWQAGCQDSNVTYLLGLAYKGQGNTRAARQALQRMARPDADGFFQMGLLSLGGNQLAQADREFDPAWQLNPDFFEAARNLLFTRLSRGQIESALAILPRVIGLTKDPQEQRLLSQLEIALRGWQPGNGEARLHPGLVDLTPQDEAWFLKVARSLGNLETARGLLTVLSASRPESAVLRDGLLETILIQGKQLLDRGDWLAAEKLLSPWAAEKEKASTATQIGLLNLLGCCSCLGQDYEAARNYFSGASFLAGTDARLYQNLALAYEWQGQTAQADGSWNRYLDLLDSRIPTPPGTSDYTGRLAFECLNRLATRHLEKEQWSEALTYLQRAQQFHPNDMETVEKLFHLLNQLKRPEEARQALRRLQDLQPGEPRVELLELELIEVNNLDKANRVVSGIERIHEKHPNDEWLENRTTSLLANLITYLERLKRQISAQKARAGARLHHLPRYKSKWPEMHEYLRDLRSRLQKISKLAGKALALAPREHQRRALNALIQQIDQELEHSRAFV
jgi:tetratricopeptide (TPR) repeat protein